MKVKKGRLLFFLAPSCMVQPPSPVSFGFSQSLLWIARSYQLSRELPARWKEAEVSVLPRLGIWAGLQKSLSARASTGRVKGVQERMLAGVDCEMGSLCLVKLHCLLTKPSRGVLKGLERSVSGYYLVNRTGRFSDSEVVLFLSLLFCPTYPFFLVIPSTGPQKSTQIISLHSVCGIIKLQRTLILTLER